MLVRVFWGEHCYIVFKKGDCLFMSVCFIFGNEVSIFDLVNDLMCLGVDVIYFFMVFIYMFGYVCCDEFRVMLELVWFYMFVFVYGIYVFL